MAPKADANPETKGPSEFEMVELEFKKMQIAMFRRQLADAEDRDRELERRRTQQVLDYKKGERERLRKQSLCKHKKGGKDNKFARGTASEYSINMNTYPTGQRVIFCTRCGKEVPEPPRKLKKENPALYKEMRAEWDKWQEYTTDNSPSGGKIFEIIAA